MTTEQDTGKDMNRNPSGKGGFGDNPQNRNPGGWKKENSISYQYRRFLNMTNAELKDFRDSSDEEKTGAMMIAWDRFVAARKSLPDAKEITDRTEGKAPQMIGIGTPDDVRTALVEFVGEDGNDDDTATEDTSQDTDTV